LLYTGITRSAESILEEQKTNVETDAGRQAVLHEMTQLARQVRDSLCNNDLDGFGEALHRGWMDKKRLASGISNPKIDAWYKRARQQGAIGGKVLGAGGGGFLLLYAHPDRHPEIIKALPELRPISFRFEPQGSKIIYVEENGHS
jgi:D-glycero-alpha-D-manno-heptose-7-phosphate kinase